jgi:hypothetical protein
MRKMLGPTSAIMGQGIKVVEGLPQDVNALILQLTEMIHARSSNS